MSVPTRVMLLACGSFNPITNMHLRMFGEYIVGFITQTLQGWVTPITPCDITTVNLVFRFGIQSTGHDFHLQLVPSISRKIVPGNPEKNKNRT